MLFQDFYSLRSMEQLDAQNYRAYILLNKYHDIFLGHFPDQPVTPGVCMMQIIKELTESLVESKLFMSKSSNVKFMALINPQQHSELKLDLEIVTTEENEVKVKNVTYFDETVALKLSCLYKKI